LSGKKGVQKGGNIQEISKEFESIRNLVGRYSFLPQITHNNNTRSMAVKMQERLEVRLSELLKKNR
jgi:hypothetical protein